MRIHPLSDLHLELGARDVRVPEGADVVVAAGDIASPPLDAVRWLAREVRPKARVVYVPGNHESWKTEMLPALREASSVAAELGIDMLSDAETVIGGVRFCGGALWTDYGLFGPGLREAVMRTCRDAMNDHKKITWSKQPWRRFRPEEAAHLHRETRTAIERSLASSDPRPLVVVTHHAPHALSLSPADREKMVSAAYASDLSALLDGRARLWIHGHTHRRADYLKDGTRVVSNCVGYPDEDVGYDPNLLVEIEEQP